MQLRTLGNSDLLVSEIALGSWLTFAVGVDRATSEACVRRALDLGINFIDTANAYGRGAAETFLGEHPPGRRPRLLRARDEGVLPDVRDRSRAERAADPQAARRLVAAAAHRSRRPLPVPPLRHRDAARGDDGGAHRGGAGGQGPLHRVQRVVAEADPSRARARRCRALRVEPADVLDAVAPSREGAVRALRGERHRSDRLLSARARCAHRQVPAGRAPAAGISRRERGDGRVHRQLHDRRRADDRAAAPTDRR